MGVELGLPADYHLRKTPRARMEAGLVDRGFLQIGLADAGPGDLLIAEPAAGQTHVALLLGATLVEANARAGRVVERRPAVDDHWVSAWRFSDWEN
jgi:hypothetical protein